MINNFVDSTDFGSVSILSEPLIFRSAGQPSIMPYDLNLVRFLCRARKTVERPLISFWTSVTVALSATQVVS